MKTAAISWLATFGIAVTTSIAGVVVGGWFANKAASWYQVPVREGGQGYFILFLALTAGIAGFVLGIMVTRFVSGTADATALRAFVAAQATVVLAITLVAGVSRVRADVPPAIGGQDLMLALEFSWPIATAPKFAPDSFTPMVLLYSSAGKGPSYGKQGPVWPEKSRTEGDRTIVPAMVEVYTSRGERIVELHINGDSANSFVVPLRGYPRRSDQQWSKWTPIAPGESSAPSYRFHVIKRNEPLRTDTVGPFTLEMSVESFRFQQYDYRPRTLDSKASYSIRYNNAPITMQAVRSTPGKQTGDVAPVNFKTINAVAVVPGASPALILQVDETYQPGSFCLLKVVNNHAVCEFMGSAIYRLFAHEMTLPATSNDTLVTNTLWSLSGSFHPSLPVNSTLYVFPESVLDAPTQTVYPIPRETNMNDLNWIAPVGISPDRKHIAKLAGNTDRPDLAVITLANGQRREVQFRNAPSPSGDWADVGPAWFNNYFVWQPGANGEYNVVRSVNAPVMAKRGQLKQEPDFRQYNLTPVDSGMREVMVEFIVKEMGGTRQPPSPGGYSIDVNVKQGKLSVGFSDNRATVFMDRGTNTLNVATFARKFDEALATHRYDSHFLKEPPE